MSLLYAAHVPSGPGPFPTIFALHGWGANAHDLLGLAPLLHGGEALVLCPQGTVAFPVGGGQYGYGWFPLTPGTAPDPAEFKKGAAALREFVTMATGRYPVDPKRTVVAGFSQGGMMAYELGLREPARFAGVAGLSSWLPPQLAEELPKLPEHEGFPVLVTHGTADTVISVERARESREALRALGVALMYREFNIGHAIDAEVLRVFGNWLKSKPFAG